MRKYVFICFLLFGWTLQAQNENNQHPIDLKKAQSSYIKHHIGETNQQEKITQFLKNNLKTEVELVHLIQSPYGKHYLFEQVFEGIKIYRSDIKVNVDLQGNITSLFNNAFELSSLTLDEFPSELKLMEFLKKSAISISEIKYEQVYFWHNSTLKPSFCILSLNNQLQYLETIIDNKGEIIYQRDMNSYHHALKDSLVKATVFMTDPLTKAGVYYGAPYIDDNDADIPELNAQRDTVEMIVDFDNDTFRLQSNYVKITEHSFPEIPPVISKVNTFYHTRSESGFEDVNVYYHINEYKKHLNSLGFSGLVNYQIHIDTHGLNGADNSVFTSFWSPPRITFGEGGVDDAEDTDVVLHEYGHAIMHSATGVDPSGTERQALDEANCDIIAASHSKTVNFFRWDEVYTWDGHNEFWNGRMTSGNKKYPTDLQNNKYADTDIWSSAIMEVWDVLGRTVTEKLLFQSAYSYATGMTMRDAAQLYMEADATVYGASHTWEICKIFLGRGLLNECTVGIDTKKEPTQQFQLTHSEAFAFGIQNAIITSASDEIKQIRMYDISGKLLYQQSFSDLFFEIEHDKFTSGCYLIEISNATDYQIFKILKY
jgi:zinc metalloprotease ZmpB